MSTRFTLSMTNDVDMPSSDIDGSNADLYAMDLPLSLAGELAAQQATTHCANVSGSTESEHLELQATAEPPPSPPFFKPASWNAIDATTAEWQANMQQGTQQEIAAQELRAVKRCLDLRRNITRTAEKRIFDSEPLVVPSSWSMSGVPIKSLVEHPFLLEEYLEGEHFSREAIRIRREYFEIKDCGSPEIRRLAAMEADYRESQASQSLLDVLLEAIQHATQKLILELTEGDKTTKRPALDLCRRLVAHSTHTDDDGELIQAVEAINDMERGHMQLQYDNVLERSTETSSTSSIPHAVAPPESSLANIVKKRRASQELAATSDCQINPTKRLNRSECDGNGNFTQVESHHANVELGESIFHTSSSTRHSANQLNR